MNVFRGGPSLDEQEVTLAERFQEKGYRTAAFVSGFTLRPHLGLTQGFELYDAPSRKQKRRWGNKTAKNAVDWLQSTPKQVFLWYHTYDPHGPWQKWGTECSKRAKGKEGLATLEKIPKYQRINDCIDLEEYKERYATAVSCGGYCAKEVLHYVVQTCHDTGGIV